MKEKKKNTIIVVVSVMTAVICIALTFWGNWKNDGILTTDAFIGIMATFIGVCATLIVGVQIVNHIEIRNMQKSIKIFENERKKMNYKMDAFSVAMYNARLSIGNTLSFMAITAQSNNDIVTEFYCLEHSIIIDDWDSMKGSALLTRYKRLSDLSKTIIPAIDKKTLEENYRRLSILVIPDKIEHHDEILSLHYQLLSEIKKRIDEPSANSVE